MHPDCRNDYSILEHSVERTAKQDNGSVASGAWVAEIYEPFSSMQYSISLRCTFPRGPDGFVDSFLLLPARSPFACVLLLLDIGNTHTHVALAQGDRIFRPINLSTVAWRGRDMLRSLSRHVGAGRIRGIALCSVVPEVTPRAVRQLQAEWRVPAFELNHKTLSGIGIDYPAPRTIGPDRLANALAARHIAGAPAVVVDFGTAVTFDVVNKRGDYVGGIIAPGLAAMTSYLHEKTALLPQIQIREVSAIIGKSTDEAMLIGAVHGYRGLIRELIQKLKRELNCRRLPVIATGGYAKLMAKKLPEITAVDPLLTLKGLRMAWEQSQG
jgi:type III pantothenate kinase